MGQTWNNILNYIKRNLGAKLNLLEMSDDEIIEGLKEDVLPYFSQFSPDKKIKVITGGNVAPTKAGETDYTFIIPLERDEYIIDIYDVYPTTESIVLDDFGYIEANFWTLIDKAMANTYVDMAKYMSVRQTWEFFPPNRLTFDRDLYGAIVVYNTLHKTLETIQPDMYTLIFKPLCSANVKKWLAALRSKYEGVATPMGELKLNWQKLEEESLRELQELEEKLKNIPLDKFIELSV